MNGKDILVIGAGVMGAGIAQVAAQSGNRVFLHDQREGAAAQARQQVRGTLEKLVAKGKWTAAVTQSVFEANFFDRRFTPSLVQRELVGGGLLGRKSGRGFYTYPAGAPGLQRQDYARPDVDAGIEMHGAGACAEALATAAAKAGLSFTRVAGSGWTGVAVGKQQLRLTDGRPAWPVARDEGIDDVAVFDELPVVPGAPLAVAVQGSATWRSQAPGWLQLLGWQPVEMADLPGLLVARTLAMLVNEACDAVQQGVCTPEAADAAMKLGTNYPAGPFEWLDRLGPGRIAAILQSLDAHYRGERYRLSARLR